MADEIMHNNYNNHNNGDVLSEDRSGEQPAETEESVEIKRPAEFDVEAWQNEVASHPPGVQVIYCSIEDWCGLPLDSGMLTPNNSQVPNPTTGSFHEVTSGQMTYISSEFTWFSLLPKEIRKKIWKQVAYDARLVVLFTLPRNSLSECTRDNGTLKAHERPGTLRRHILYQVCRESRQVVLELHGFHGYRSYYFQRWNITKIDPHPYTFFDPRHDWLCVDVGVKHSSAFGMMTKNSQALIGYEALEMAGLARNVAFISRTGSFQDNYRWILNCAKGLFPMMKKLGIVCEIVTLHVQREKAWEAGLFQYGDTQILVDRNDEVQMEKFYNFHRMHGGHQTPTEPSEVSSLPRSPSSQLRHPSSSPTSSSLESNFAGSEKEPHAPTRGARRVWNFKKLLLPRQLSLSRIERYKESSKDLVNIMTQRNKKRAPEDGKVLAHFFTGDDSCESSSVTEREQEDSSEADLAVTKNETQLVLSSLPHTTGFVLFRICGSSFPDRMNVGGACRRLGN
ncbi:hypothetical protein GGS21DRAFT_489589 [Xylaria nigripes]|nr:hypothetical protein GGS21DRAFT_489589 [Xylaria nigripes]